MGILRRQNRSAFGTILIVFMVTMAVALGGVGKYLPDRVVVPWAQGECFWFNGTIIHKEEVGLGMTTDYLFYVNGTLDNDTDFDSIIHGGRAEYIFLPVGQNYQGQVCDTMTLREAVINGTIEIVNYATG